MDPIEFPENLTELSAENLTELASNGRSVLAELYAVEAPSVAQATEAERLAKGVRGVDAEIAARAAAAQSMAALQAEFTAEPEPEPVPEPEPEPEPAPEPPAEVVETPAEAPAEAPPVQEAAVPEPVLNTAALEGQRPVVPARATRRITAAADVPGVATGNDMTYAQLAEKLLEKFSGFPKPAGQNDFFGGDLRTFGLAQIDKGIPDDLVIHDGMGYEQKVEILDRAANLDRLPQKSLVAAGGWCAPSETTYDLADSGETTDGMLSLPEVGMGRGGVRFTLGPDYADIYALDNFFKMTEAQAIAGSFTKPCFTVECPTFDDHRLDAYGYCFQIPFLTEAAYPEVIKRYLSGSLVAYAHKMNADKIGRVVDLLTDTDTATDIGTTTQSVSNALQIIIDRERGKRRWGFNQPVEVVLDYWVKGLIKQDLQMRGGFPFKPATDADVAAIFSAVNAVPQWVYDWNDLGDTDVDYPSTFDILLYKAGTFVAGTTSVVNLSSVYDAASLATNMYTGAFFEEGMTVIRRGFGGVVITVPVCNSGKSGAQNIDLCPVGP